MATETTGNATPSENPSDANANAATSGDTGNGASSGKGAKPAVKWHLSAGPNGEELPKGSLEHVNLRAYWDLFDGDERVAMIPDEYFKDELHAAHYGIALQEKRKDIIRASVNDRLAKCDEKIEQHKSFIAHVEEVGNLETAKKLSEIDAMERKIAEMRAALAEDMD